MENLLIQASFPFLTLLVALPTVGALLIWLVPGFKGLSRQLGLVFSLATLILFVIAAMGFDYAKSGTYQLAETYRWIPTINTYWALGINGLGLLMVGLAVFLVPLVLLAAMNEDDEAEDPVSSRALYTALILVLESFMVLVFAARDVFLFYVAFEAMLVPLYFMIGRFGGPNRKAAALKFVLYSLAGGLIMLVGVIGVRVWGGTFLLEQLSGKLQLGAGTELAMFVSFFIAFAIKAPLVPVHTWLPDTAAQSRPGTATLLVGVLDKIGTFGLIAIVLPLFPQASHQARWVVIALGLISVIWGGLAAIWSKDIMRLIAYTSVSHFGLMVVGIFIGSPLAMAGAMIFMLAHGLSIAGMFLGAGFLTQRGGSNMIADFRGMQRVTPVLAGTWLISGLAAVALPGLSGFVPEYMVLVGTFKVSATVSVIAVFGVILSALYLLIPYQAIFTGPPSGKADKAQDLSLREKTVVAPLIVAMAVVGIASAPFIKVVEDLSTNTVSAVIKVTDADGSAK